LKNSSGICFELIVVIKIKLEKFKTEFMKTSSSIEVISKMDIPVQAIEKYINTNINRLKTKTNKDTHFNAFSHSFEKVDCCSAYVDVNGTVEICFKDGRPNNFRSVKVNVATKYFFTCAQEKDQLYKVAWGTSLS